MKLRHLLYAAAAVLPLLFSCDNQEKPLLPTVTVNPAFVTLEAGASVQTVSIQAGRGWVVYAKPDWVDAVNPESGKASSSGESVTFSVKSNSGNDREGYIVFSTGLARAAFKIKQKGEAGELTPGTGTKDDPFSVAAAIEETMKLASGGVSTQAYYIKGKIAKINKAKDKTTQEEYDDNFTNNLARGYHNATFYMTDSGEEGGKGQDFEAYRVQYLGNVNFVSGDTDIKLKDEVVLYCKLKNYNGSQAENDSGAFIYSLNGVSKGGDDPVDPGNIEQISIQEFVTRKDNNTYRLVGKVSNFTITNVEKKYMSFDIKDESGATAKAYYFENGVFDEWSGKIKDFGTITLTGKYLEYKDKNTGAITHEIQNVKIEEFVEGEVISVDGTIADVIAAEAGAEVSTSGTVVATYNKGFIIKDASGSILVFTNNTPPTVSVGDAVKVSGKRAAYAGLPQIGEPAYEKTGTATVTYPEAKDITSILDTYSATVTEYISLTGTFKVDGTYYNVIVDGATKKAGIQYPSDALAAVIKNYDGVVVTVKGYCSGIQEKFVQFMAVEITPSNAPYCIASPKEIKVKADVTSAEIKITANSDWTLTARGDITLSDATGTAGSEISGSADATVTATFAANESTETNNVYTLVLVCEAASVNETITITQSKVSAEGADKYVLDGTAIGAAHSEAWKYDSGEKKITATDGSVWTCFNTYANKNQVTVQMNKAKGAYVLTPELPSGKEIKTISVVLNKSSNGTGDMGDRPMDILSADGNTTLLNNVTGQDLADGLAVAAGHSQVRVICDETDGGAVYITSITVTF